MKPQIARRTVASSTIVSSGSWWTAVWVAPSLRKSRSNHRTGVVTAITTVGAHTSRIAASQIRSPPVSGDLGSTTAAAAKVASAVVSNASRALT